MARMSCYHGGIGVLAFLRVKVQAIIDDLS